MNEKDFAARLYRLRENIGVSARLMSREMGLNSGYISSIENCKSMPKMGNFFRICDYLKVTPLEFFDTSRSDPTKSSLIMDYLEGLSDSERDHILLVVRDLFDKNHVKEQEPDRK